jgi:hypothetical protein
MATRHIRCSRQFLSSQRFMVSSVGYGHAHCPIIVPYIRSNLRHMRRYFKVEVKISSVQPLKRIRGGALGGTRV